MPPFRQRINPPSNGKLQASRHNVLHAAPAANRRRGISPGGSVFRRACPVPDAGPAGNIIQRQLEPVLPRTSLTTTGRLEGKLCFRATGPVNPKQGLDRLPPLPTTRRPEPNVSGLGRHPGLYRGGLRGNYGSTAPGRNRLPGAAKACHGPVRKLNDNPRFARPALRHGRNRKVIAGLRSRKRKWRSSNHMKERSSGFSYHHRPSRSFPPIRTARARLTAKWIAVAANVGQERKPKPTARCMASWLPRADSLPAAYRHSRPPPLPHARGEEKASSPQKKTGSTMNHAGRECACRR